MFRISIISVIFIKPKNRYEQNRYEEQICGLQPQMTFDSIETLKLQTSPNFCSKQLFGLFVYYMCSMIACKQIENYMELYTLCFCFWDIITISKNEVSSESLSYTCRRFNIDIFPKHSGCCFVRAPVNCNIGHTRLSKRIK